MTWMTQEQKDGLAAAAEAVKQSEVLVKDIVLIFGNHDADERCIDGEPAQAYEGLCHVEIQSPGIGVAFWFESKYYFG